MTGAPPRTNPLTPPLKGSEMVLSSSLIAFLLGILAGTVVIPRVRAAVGA